MKNIARVNNPIGRTKINNHITRGPKLHNSKDENSKDTLTLLQNTLDEILITLKEINNTIKNN